MMNPEPRLCRTCSCWGMPPKKCLKSWSIWGSPKGDCRCTFTTCLVEMLTTAAPSFLTSGAKDSGAGTAFNKSGNRNKDGSAKKNKREKRFMGDLLKYRTV